jgi:hypothetical protein
MAVVESDHFSDHSQKYTPCQTTRYCDDMKIERQSQKKRTHFISETSVSIIQSNLKSSFLDRAISVRLSLYIID